MTTTRPAAETSRLERLAALCQAWTEDDPQRTVVVHVSRHGNVVAAQAFGVMHPLSGGAASLPTQTDAIFLVASLTKPLTALAACLLVDRCQILLDDPVCAYIPAFAGGDRPQVHIRHLLTHTSGLPDMLPENIALRQAHAPLTAFIERTCTTDLLFSPGTDCRYQSMGTLLAAAIVERVSGLPLPDFLAREFFRPLGMANTWLGMGALPAERLVRVILPPGTEQTSWNWNSPYWRGLGSPWGGLHTTAGDYARVLDMMLDGGRFGQTQIVSAAMTSAMLTNQLLGMPALSARAQRENGWGLGWRLNQPPGTHGLPEIAPVCTFGHGGATGTVAWGDPDSGLACVILTNDPQSADFRARASNLVAGMAT